MTIKITNKDNLNDIEILGDLVAELLTFGEQLINDFKTDVQGGQVFRGKRIDIQIFK